MTALPELQLRAATTLPDRRRRRLGLIAVTTPGALALLVALLGPFVAPHGESAIIGPPLVGSRTGLPLGTDYLGHDVLSRVLHGGRTLVLLPLLATLTVSGLGMLLGTLSGYIQGRFDRGVVAVLDILLALPWLLVLVVIVSGWGGGPVVLVLAVVLTGSPFVARIARAATLQVVHSDYVEQAHALGEPLRSILAHEILPNVAAPLLADAGLRLVASLYLVATASFLGFGPQPPAADWGLMISENVDGMALTPWGVILPAILIGAMAVSANLMVDLVANRLAR
jgi:ABC-type dipeptide/oligopeptide/nickel transport system permease subunit